MLPGYVILENTRLVDLSLRVRSLSIPLWKDDTTQAPSVGQPLFFFDLEHSPLVDPSNPQESQRRLNLLRNFLFGQGGVLQGNENFVFLVLP